MLAAFRGPVPRFILLLALGLVSTALGVLAWVAFIRWAAAGACI